MGYDANKNNIKKFNKLLYCFHKIAKGKIVNKSIINPFICYSQNKDLNSFCYNQINKTIHYKIMYKNREHWICINKEKLTKTLIKAGLRCYLNEYKFKTIQ